jgi:hypothetical protein
MMNMLSDHNASFMANLLTDKTGWNIAYKSGTQFEQYNGLLMAASTQYAVGMWVGCPDHCTQNPICNDGTSGSPVYLNCGATTQMEFLTVPVVKSFMLNVLSNQKPINWTPPAGIQTLPAFCQTRRLNSDIPPTNCNNYSDIYPSWYKPQTTSSTYSVDIVSGDVATGCTPSLAAKTINPSTGASIFSIDPFTNTGSNVNLYNTSVTDPVHLCSDQKPTVTFTDPSTAPSCSEGSCSFAITVTQGTHPLTSNAYPLQVFALIDGKSFTASCSFNPTMDPNNSPEESNGNCTFTDPSVGNGDSLQVQAVDSVLYSATSASEAVNVSNVYTNIVLTVTNDHTPSPTVSWTSTGSDAYDCSVGNNTPYPVTMDKSNGTDSCNITGLTNNTYTVTVTDTNSSDPGSGTTTVHVN